MKKNSKKTQVDLNRTIYFIGEINENSTSAFMSNFHEMDSTKGDITVFISSRGGELDSGIALYDTVKLAKNKVLMVGCGVVGSAAILPFLAGKMRAVQPNCELYFHEIFMSGSDNMLNKSKVDNMMESMGKKSQKYCELVSKNSKLSAKQVMDLCVKDVYIPANQAMEYGMIEAMLGDSK